MDAIGKIKDSIAKILTILIDRRFQIVAGFTAIVAILGLFGISQEEIALLTEYFDAGIAAVILLGHGIVALLAVAYSVGKLLESWGVRPPSGTNYQAVAQPFHAAIKPEKVD